MRLVCFLLFFFFFFVFFFFMTSAGPTCYRLCVDFLTVVCSSVLFVRAVDALVCFLLCFS
jgi:hypothetical protein